MTCSPILVALLLVSIVALGVGLANLRYVRQAERRRADLVAHLERLRGPWKRP